MSNIISYKHCVKRKPAFNEQLLHLPQCFQLYSIVMLSFQDFFHISAGMFSKSYAAYMLYVRDGLRLYNCAT